MTAFTSCVACHSLHSRPRCFHRWHREKPQKLWTQNALDPFRASSYLPPITDAAAGTKHLLPGKFTEEHLSQRARQTPIQLASPHLEHTQVCLCGPEAGAPAWMPATCFAFANETSGAVHRRWTYQSHQSLPERKLRPLPPWDLASGSFFMRTG